jgi:hypothetical protein
LSSLWNPSCIWILAGLVLIGAGIGVLMWWRRSP